MRFTKDPYGTEFNELLDLKEFMAPSWSQAKCMVVRPQDAEGIMNIKNAFTVTDVLLSALLITVLLHMTCSKWVKACKVLALVSK